MWARGTTSPTGGERRRLRPTGARSSREREQETQMRTMWLVAVTGPTGAGAAARHRRAQQAGATRTELQRQDLSVPGREVIQVRVDLEPGYTFPSHTHPGEEIIYVIEGTWQYEIDGKRV